MLAWTLVLVMVLTSVSLPGSEEEAKGAVTVPEEGMDKAAEEAVTIKGTAGDGNGHETLERITAKEMMDGYGDGLTLDEIRTNNATVYVHITKCSRYSRLKISGGQINSDSGTIKTSNKELIGTKCTTSTNPAYILHGGYRTKAGEGSGCGVAESGNYAFPANGMNGVVANDTISAEKAGILLRRMTTDVDGYIIGIVFAGGKSISVAEDGTITKGFDPKSITLESTGEDDSDVSNEEKAKEGAAMRAALKSAIDVCESFSEDEYEADSIAKVRAALPAAKKVYDNPYDTKANYRAARDALENVRAAIVPKMTADEGNPKDFRILDKKEVINEMGAGINLGNTFDGVSGWLTPSETGWQAYKTTKEYIRALHDAGYNTVRVPVTWGSMINDDYSIKESWISRVQEVVDYCVAQDMYCIINIHHDGAANHDNRGDNTPGSWLDTYATDIEGVYAKFSGTWKTIANRFKDYDEHLIFEGMNEVTDAHGTATNEDTEILNNLNQIFVNTVRATGSNNTKRWLAFTGRFATYSTGTTMPKDPLVSSDASTTRLMFSVHIYKDNSSVRWTRAQLVTWSGSLSSTVSNVNNLDRNIPIYIGEYGVKQQKQTGSETGYNNAERALNSEFCNAAAKFYGACPIVWDQGLNDYSSIATDTGNFVYWNRPALKPVYDDVIEGMIRGTYADYDYYKALDSNDKYELADLIDPIYKSYGHSSTSDNSVSKDPTVTKITDITVDRDTVSLKAGERTTLRTTVAPETNNDVILWSTDDDAVATVSQGMVHAKRAGITTIHAYSQSGTVKKDIKVVVAPSGKETSNGISTKKPYYSVAQGKTVAIETTLLPANSKDEVTYTSSNTDVATVNSSGVVTGISPGYAYVIVTAASGISTIVNIRVKGKSTGKSVNVALNAYYASGEESGTPVTIEKDGQYTVTLDFSKDLSDAGKKAGITALKDMVSIYIKDKNASNPVVEEAQIRYDRITLDDTTDLTITSTGFKSAIKSNGQFDTNDPINGWDGSVVSSDEITVNSSAHTVSFKNVTNPQKISVTFTIQGLKFFKSNEKENEAESMTTTDEDIIRIPEVGDTKELTLSLAPVDTDSFVTVYSTNSSVVAVDNAARAADKTGSVKVSLTAVSEGTAIIVCIAENGLKVVYSVGVGDREIAEPYDPTPEGLDGSLEEIEPTPDTNNSPAPDTSSEPVPDTSSEPAPDTSSEPAPNTNSEPAPVSGATTNPNGSGGPGQQEITVASAVKKALNAKSFTLEASTDGDGTLSYSSSDEKVADINSSGKVTIKAIGTVLLTVTASATDSYQEAKATCQLTVTPNKAKISKVKNVAGGKLKVTWKMNKEATGYEVSYSTDGKFKKDVGKASVDKVQTTSTTIKKLKKGAKYYVRVRAYKKVGSKKIYGSYSAAKSLKIKK